MRFMANMRIGNRSRSRISAAIGMLQRGRKAAAYDVAQDVEYHDVRVLEQMVLLEEFHGLAHHVAAAAGPGGRPAGLDAHHPVVPLVTEVLERSSSE